MLENYIFQIAIVLLGITGLAISTYLHFKKKTAVEGMACPMDGSCEDVITSKYSKFLGFDVEIFGILYYLTIIVAYILFLVTGYAVPSWFTLGVLLVTIGAVIFSVYLTYLQGVQLQMWCTWCVGSAIVSTTILVLAVPATAVSIPELMVQYSEFLLWMGIVSAATGFGVSVSYDTLLLSSLKDFELAETQADMLNNLNHVSWTAIAAVIVSGTGLVLGDPDLLADPAFITSSIALGFLILNDSFYTFNLAERVEKIRYSEEEDLVEVKNLRRYIMIFAGISSFSWLTVLSLKIFDIGSGFEFIAGSYLIGLAVIIFLTLFINLLMNRRAKDNLPEWSPLH